MGRDTLNVEGILSPVLRAGDRSDPEAVVAVHGNPGSSEDWRALLAESAPFARVFAPDMPGFGQADKPADFAYTVDGYASHLGRMLDAEGIRRAHLVLHDFGGPWGLEWAARHPDRVASLTLVDTGLLPGYRWHYMARLWRMPWIGELTMAATNRTSFGVLLRHGNPRGLPRAFVDRMYRDFDAGTRRAVLRLYRATDDLGAFADRVGGRLSPLGIPTLVLWGLRDPYLPARYADLQRDYFAVRRMVRLDRSGHWPMADDPQGVAQAVVPFLRERVGRS